MVWTGISQSAVSITPIDLTDKAARPKRSHQRTCLNSGLSADAGNVSNRLSCSSVRAGRTSVKASRSGKTALMVSRICSHRRQLCHQHCNYAT